MSPSVLRRLAKLERQRMQLLEQEQQQQQQQQEPQQQQQQQQQQTRRDQQSKKQRHLKAGKEEVAFPHVDVLIESPQICCVAQQQQQQHRKQQKQQQQQTQHRQQQPVEYGVESMPPIFKGELVRVSVHRKGPQHAAFAKHQQQPQLQKSHQQAQQGQS